MQSSTAAWRNIGPNCGQYNHIDRTGYRKKIKSYTMCHFEKSHAGIVARRLPCDVWVCPQTVGWRNMRPSDLGRDDKWVLMVGPRSSICCDLETALSHLQETVKPIQNLRKNLWKLYRHGPVWVQIDFQEHWLNHFSSSERCHIWFGFVFVPLEIAVSFKIVFDRWALLQKFFDYWYLNGWHFCVLEVSRGVGD